MRVLVAGQPCTVLFQQFRVVVPYTHALSLYLFCFPDLFPYKWPQGYRHMVCAWGDHTWMAHPFDVLM